MISITHKRPTSRTALASATLLFSHPDTYLALDAATNKKGDALAIARIAAIQAVKQTATLIPLAHPSLAITGITVDLDIFDSETRQTVISETHNSTGTGTGLGMKTTHFRGANGGVEVLVSVSCEGKTGVEMEALVGASVGALTLYDMLKGVDKGLVVGSARVLEKRGGKSGGWKWDGEKGKVVQTGVGMAGQIEGGVDGGRSEELKQDSKPGQMQMQAQSGREVELERREMKTETDEWNKGLAREFSVQDKDR